MDSFRNGLFVALAVVALASASFAALNHAGSVTIVQNRPLVAMSTQNVVSANAVAEIALADCANTSEDTSRHYVIQNTHASNNACVYVVAAGAACGSAYDCDIAGTDDGRLIPAGKGVKLSYACDLRMCVVAGATLTTVHVSGDEI